MTATQDNINQQDEILKCPVCDNEYVEGSTQQCSVCNWDLMPFLPEFIETYNTQIAWAREIWLKSKHQGDKLIALQSQAEIFENDKLRLEGEILYRIEKLEQTQSTPIAYSSPDTSNVNALEQRLSKVETLLQNENHKQKKIENKIHNLYKHLKKIQSRDNIVNNSLISRSGINYTRLAQFLKIGKWKEANEETKMIIEALFYKAGILKNSIPFFSKDSNECQESLKKIDCQDLLIIDKLWTEYSYGKFGFSVQHEIYYSSSIDSCIELFGWRELAELSHRGLIGANEDNLHYEVYHGHLPCIYFITWRQRQGYYQYEGKIFLKELLCKVFDCCENETCILDNSDFDDDFNYESENTLDDKSKENFEVESENATDNEFEEDDSDNDLDNDYYYVSQ